MIGRYGIKNYNYNKLENKNEIINFEDSEFYLWKSELKKELSNFWNSFYDN